VEESAEKEVEMKVKKIPKATGYMISGKGKA